MTESALRLRPSKTMPIAARLALALLVWVLAAVLMAPARADLPPVHAGHIVIEQAFATPGQVGGSSQLRFRIRNDTAQSFHLMGVRTAVAGSAQIVARTSDLETTVMDSIVVPADGVLDLLTSHMWMALEDLSVDLEPGGEFDAELILHFPNGSWTVTLQVHVHAAQAD